jgi:hypothetical protein
MRRNIFAISILVITIAPASFGADTHYVSHDGTDEYPYTSWATATDSILLAIDAADEWDTVRLAAGVFTADTIGLKKGLVFAGAGRDSTRIVHNGNDPQGIYLIDSCVVQGIHLQGLTDTLVTGEIIFHLVEGMLGQEDQSALVRDCRLSDIEYAVRALWTDRVNPSKRVVLENNEFSNFYEAAGYWFCSSRIIGNRFHVDFNDIGGPIKQDLGNAEIRNNVFIRKVRFSAPIIELDACDTICVQNNVCLSFAAVDNGVSISINPYDEGFPTLGMVENNFCLGGQIGIVSYGGNLRIRNNIITGTTYVSLHYDKGATSPGYVGFNLFWNNADNWTPADTLAMLAVGSVFANPMFVDSLNFYLQAFSPAIDAGDTLVLDLDGSRSDIGPYGGLRGEWYLYQDLAPALPIGLAAEWQDSGAALTWLQNSEADLEGYRLYRDSVPISVPNPLLMLAEITAGYSAFFDTSDLRGKTVYYRLTAVDGQSNESALSNEVVLSVSGIDDENDPSLPTAFALHPNYPNPFNAATSFVIDVPTSGLIRVTVYDLLGRKVATLHDAVTEPGTHRFRWHATDAPSGVYFVVAKLNGSTRVRKAVLLK